MALKLNMNSMKIAKPLSTNALNLLTEFANKEVKVITKGIIK